MDPVLPVASLLRHLWMWLLSVALRVHLIEHNTWADVSKEASEWKESIYGINSKPKFQYFSNMPAVLNVFIKMYNIVIFSTVLVQMEVDPCHMEVCNLLVEVPHSSGARRRVWACAIELLVCCVHGHQDPAKLLLLLQRHMGALSPQWHGKHNWVLALRLQFSIGILLKSV